MYKMSLLLWYDQPCLRGLMIEYMIEQGEVDFADLIDDIEFVTPQDEAIALLSEKPFIVFAPNEDSISIAFIEDTTQQAAVIEDVQDEQTCIYTLIHSVTQRSYAVFSYIMGDYDASDDVSFMMFM